MVVSDGMSLVTVRASRSATDLELTLVYIVYLLILYHSEAVWAVLNIHLEKSMPVQPNRTAMMWVNSLCLVHPREASVAWMSL